MNQRPPPRGRSAHEAGNSQRDDRAQLDHATRQGRAIVTRNVVHFLQIACDAVAANTRHAGIILVPSSFRGDEYQAIADAIVEGLEPYPQGLDGLVICVKQPELKAIREIQVGSPSRARLPESMASRVLPRPDDRGRRPQRPDAVGDARGGLTACEAQLLPAAARPFWSTA
jgi:hypothetical protein